MHIPSAQRILCLVGSLLGACSLQTGGSGQVAGELGSDDPDSEGTLSEDARVSQASSDAARAASSSHLADASISADKTGHCKAGSYVGTFTCPYQQQGLGFGGMTTSNVTGVVRFTLAAAHGDTDFVLVDGSFVGNGNALQTVTADIQGTFECGHDLSARLVMGEATGYVVFTSAFEAPLLASYDEDHAAFVDGTWSVPASSNTGGCNGTWTARYIEP